MLGAGAWGTALAMQAAPSAASERGGISSAGVSFSPNATAAAAAVANTAAPPIEHTVSAVAAAAGLRVAQPSSQPLASAGVESGFIMRKAIPASRPVTKSPPSGKKRTIGSPSSSGMFWLMDSPSSPGCLTLQTSAGFAPAGMAGSVQRMEKWPPASAVCADSQRTCPPARIENSRFAPASGLLSIPSACNSARISSPGL